MKLVDAFDDSFDELLELGFIEPAGTDVNGDPEYRTTELGKHFFSWQRKIKTGEMFTPEDFEHREAWVEAINRFNAKQDRE